MFSCHRSADFSANKNFFCWLNKINNIKEGNIDNIHLNYEHNSCSVRQAKTYYEFWCNNPKVTFVSKEWLLSATDFVFHCQVVILYQKHLEVFLSLEWVLFFHTFETNILAEYEKTFSPKTKKFLKYTNY